MREKFLLYRLKRLKMNRIKEDKLNNKEIIYLNIIKIFACFMVIINHTNGFILEYNSFANTTRKVLAERPSGREGFLMGTADNFLTVEFPGKVSDIGKIMPIEIRRHNEFQTY